MDNLRNGKRISARTIGEKTHLEVIKTCVISSVILGIIIHGMVLFNKLSWHDDAGAIVDEVGVTFSSGRWFLEYAGRFVKLVYGMNVSIPILHGLFSFICIGLSIGLICVCFGLHCRLTVVILSALGVSFPTVTATFAYMFTSGYYFFALFLSTFGAVLIIRGMKNDCRKYTFSCIMAGILSIVLATSIYQAYFIIAVCVCWLSILQDSLDHTVKFSKLLRNIVICMVSVLCGLISYLVSNKLVLKMVGVDLSEYEGLNTIYKPSVGKLLQGVLNAIKAFWGMVSGNYMGFYGIPLVRIAVIILLICAVVEFAFLFCNINGAAKKAMALLVFLCMPIVFNSIEIFVANGNGIVHGLMGYGGLFSLFTAFFICEWRNGIKSEPASKDDIFYKFIKTAGIVAVVGFFFLDNLCYFKAYIYQNQATQYYNRLLSRIESTEGYYTGMQVWLWGDFDEDSFISYPGLEDVKVTGYDGYGAKTMINNWSYDLERFLSTHNGFNIELLTDTAGITLDDRYMNLSSYPSDNSIMVIDDVLVVRLSK